MEGIRQRPEQLVSPLCAWLQATPLYIVFAYLASLLVLGLLSPRVALPSEKTYVTSSPEKTPTALRQLPCWHDRWYAELHSGEQQLGPDAAHAVANVGSIEPAEVYLSVVFPAFNEQDRIIPTLEEAVAYLDEHVGRTSRPPVKVINLEKKQKSAQSSPNAPARESPNGYEIIVVDDGSRDNTVAVVLAFAKKHELHDILRVVSLAENRGKGGGVTHGLRHVRGEFALFADADGASLFSDVSKLIEGCEEVVDGASRGVAIGSRAHLVGSEAVVKRSALRNFLMRSFHLVLTILTPPATSRIRDTQCGFKLFSRAALPYIIPYMHAEGWIFDIEMLMLAESAPAGPILGSDGNVIGFSPGIKVAEVPIRWHEVGGSKLNVIQDSVKMAVGLSVLRASWMMGVYRRRLT